MSNLINLTKEMLFLVLIRFLAQKKQNFLKIYAKLEKGVFINDILIEFSFLAKLKSLW